MASEYDWESGEGLSSIDDPAAVDAAFERCERHLAAAVIGLAFTCPPEVASPRIVRAMRVLDAPRREYAFTAAGIVARLHGELTPELYVALRAEGPGGSRERHLRHPDVRAVPDRPPGSARHPRPHPGRRRGSGTAALH